MAQYDPKPPGVEVVVDAGALPMEVGAESAFERWHLCDRCRRRICRCKRCTSYRDGFCRLNAVAIDMGKNEWCTSSWEQAAPVKLAQIQKKDGGPE